MNVIQLVWEWKLSMVIFGDYVWLIMIKVVMCMLLSSQIVIVSIGSNNNVLGKCKLLWLRYRYSNVKVKINLIFLQLEYFGVICMVKLFRFSSLFVLFMYIRELLKNFSKKCEIINVFLIRLIMERKCYIFWFKSVNV